MLRTSLRHLCALPQLPYILPQAGCAAPCCIHHDPYVTCGPRQAMHILPSFVYVAELRCTYPIATCTYCVTQHAPCGWLLILRWALCPPLLSMLSPLVAVVREHSYL